MTTMQKHALKDDISFEIKQHVFLVNFINLGTYKINIVHIYHIDMDNTHNSARRILSYFVIMFNTYHTYPLFYLTCCLK